MRAAEQYTYLRTDKRAQDILGNNIRISDEKSILEMLEEEKYMVTEVKVKSIAKSFLRSFGKRSWQRIELPQARDV
jgi:hypothetical protein